MKSIGFSATLAVVLLSLFVVSAYGGPYTPITPGVPTIPQPPVLLAPARQISGGLCFHYPDGSNVTLASPPVMEVRACPSSGGCTVINVALIRIGNSTTGCCYTYAMNTTLPGFPTGSVTLYIVAGSLRDKSGTAFPGADTLIGTVLVSSPAPEAPSSLVQPSPVQASPVQAASNNKPSSVFINAETATQTNTNTISNSPSNAIPLVLVLLAVAGAALILLPRRRQ